MALLPLDVKPSLAIYLICCLCCAFFLYYLTRHFRQRQSKREHHALEKQTLASPILSEQERLNCIINTALAKDSLFISRLISVIEDNLSNYDYTIEQLSSDLGLSRSALYKKTKSSTGVSPMDFLKIMRIKKAVELIEQGENSVSQIAWKVGYSPKQFSLYFKNEFGCLPSKYISSTRLTNP